MNKKGLSGVVVTLLLVGLALVLMLIVWGAVNGIVGDKIERSEKCFGNFGEVEINSRLTCYDTDDNEAQFSITLGDIDIEGILVSISSETQSESFTLTNEAVDLPKLRNFDGTQGEKIPSKKGGETYIYEWDGGILGQVAQVQIAPIIEGEQCDVSSSFKGIDNCFLLP